MTQRIERALGRNIRALLPSDPKRVERLPAPPTKVAIGESRGRVAATKSPVGSASGGSIASPLTEVDYADRTYHTGKFWSTSDGMILWQAIASITFNDANSAEVVLNFDSPP